MIGIDIGVEYPDWMLHGLCAQTDPDAFFPERGSSSAQAKAVCRRCEVRATCLDYALDNGIEWGVWGGTSDRDRRAIRRDRGQVAA